MNSEAAPWNAVFTTHTGERIGYPRLGAALLSVANTWKELAKAVRVENAYADHVTDQEKEKIMLDMLEQADRICMGVEPMGFWLWQRVNLELTGKCVGFLP